MGRWRWGSMERGATVREPEIEKRDMAMDHRSPLVQGKFIGNLARILVICLAVHWSPGSISLPLQSAQLDKRARGLSNLPHPGRGYMVQKKF